MSALYVVATPIGNLEDFSPRAIKTLQEADLILAEDTRVTVKLLNAFAIKTPLESYHQHNEFQKAHQVIERMQQENLKVALETDAGTPAVSAPGARVVSMAHAAGIQVIAIPGPSAYVSALSKSGFEHTEFAFQGFLPRKKNELKDKLLSLQGGAPLAVLYESPHRVVSLLQAIAEVFPGAQLSVSRELSKLHEQTLNGTVEQILQTFNDNEGLLRGEFVPVLEIPKADKADETSESSLSPEAHLVDLMLKGRSLRDAKAELLTRGFRKNAVYVAGLNLSRLAYNLLDKGEEEASN